MKKTITITTIERSPPSFKFCAEGAEKIFYAIATQEPFAPKVRRLFLFQKLNPETAKKSLCKIAFFFTKLSIFRLRAKFSKNGG